MSENHNLQDEHSLIEDRLGERARVYGTERAILVAVEKPGEVVEDSLNELESLADTAGITVVAVLTQKRLRPDRSTFIGKGKVNELKAAAGELDADVIVLNNELSPAQARNLEKGVNRKVIDRTQLIMDIFAQRAETKEAKLQVELAQLHYLLPRLRGWGIALTRLGGGIGTRGPGETQLELDRKKIYRRIHALERRLNKAKSERELKSKRRAASPLPHIVLAGYTNSGKSTLLNRLCQADAFVEDKLFATLATTVRRGELSPGRWALFTDTVGFIRDLPHHLVPAFAATLEAVRHADLILHVVDSSRSSCEQDYRAVLTALDQEVFSSDEGVRPPIIDLLNKADLIDHERVIPAMFDGGLRISAKEGLQIDRLRERIRAVLDQGRKPVSFLIPYARSGLLQHLLQQRDVSILGYTEDGIEIETRLSTAEIAHLQGAGAKLKTFSSPKETVSL